LDSIAGVTDSPNLATGFGTVRFFSNSFRRSLIGSIAGSGVLCDDGDPDGLSNNVRFSIKVFRDAVSVNSDPTGDFVTGVTVNVFSVRHVLAGTAGFSRSGDT
jgi:hypothetical protein